MIHRQKRDAFGDELTARITVFIAANAWAFPSPPADYVRRRFRTHVTHQRPAVNQLCGWAKKWLCFIRFTFCFHCGRLHCAGRDEDCNSGTSSLNLDMMSNLRGNAKAVDGKSRGHLHAVASNAEVIRPRPVKGGTLHQQHLFL